MLTLNHLPTDFYNQYTIIVYTKTQCQALLLFMYAHTLVTSTCELQGSAHVHMTHVTRQNAII